MRKNITKLMIILSIISSIIILFNTVNGESLVDSDTIEDWSNSYLDEYMKIVEDNFGQEYGYYFNFYGTHPFEIKSAISSKNGVAIEIIPREDKSEMTFENIYTDEKIGIAVFENNVLNNTIVDIDAYNYMRSTEKSDKAMFEFGGLGAISNLSIFTKSDDGVVNWHFVDMDKSGDFLLIKVGVDGVRFEYTYVDNNNSISYWTEEHAKIKARNHIERGLMDVFVDAFENDEFKNFFAQPELKSKLVNIKNKLDETRKNASYNYTTYDLKIDLKEVDYIAFEKYGITNEFFQYIIEFLDADYIFPSDDIPSTTQKQDNEKSLWAISVGATFSIISKHKIISHHP